MDQMSAHEQWIQQLCSNLRFKDYGYISLKKGLLFLV